MSTDCKQWGSTEGSLGLCWFSGPGFPKARIKALAALQCFLVDLGSESSSHLILVPVPVASGLRFCFLPYYCKESFSVPTINPSILYLCVAQEVSSLGRGPP